MAAVAAAFCLLAVAAAYARPTEGDGAKTLTITNGLVEGARVSVREADGTLTFIGLSDENGEVQIQADDLNKEIARRIAGRVQHCDRRAI